MKQHVAAKTFLIRTNGKYCDKSCEALYTDEYNYCIMFDVGESLERGGDMNWYPDINRCKKCLNEFGE